MEIIPAIDIMDGKCVRLTQGDYARKKVYSENPLEVALQFEGAGIRRLHLVDLDGAKKGMVVNYKTLERIAAKTKLIIDFGGGIKDDETIRQVFDSGASMASIGSVAVKDKTLFYSWIDTYGAGKLLLGADVKDKWIVISGWLEETKTDVFGFIGENKKKGIQTVFCTDISRDGLLQGPSLDLYEEMLQRIPDIKLIASGGISGMSDLYALQKIGCSGAIVGKAIYEGRIMLEELKKFNGC